MTLGRAGGGGGVTLAAVGKAWAAVQVEKFTAAPSPASAELVLTHVLALASRGTGPRPELAGEK